MKDKAAQQVAGHIGLPKKYYIHIRIHILIHEYMLYTTYTYMVYGVAPHAARTYYRLTYHFKGFFKNFAKLFFLL